MENARMRSMDQRHESGFTRGLPHEERTPEVAKLAALARHLNGGCDASDGGTSHADRLARDHSFQSLSSGRTINVSSFPDSPGFEQDEVESDKPSFARRIFRSFARFLIVALIGAGITLGWQSH